MIAARILAALAVLGLTATAQGGTQQRPGQEIDQKALCLACHELDQGRVGHAPVEAGECSECHNPHVARHGGLLRERPGRLCARCHEEFTEILRRGVLHAPVAEGRCADCHQAHGGPHEGLLTQGPETLCASCHEGVNEWKGKAVQHAPFADGSCEVCHDSHASDASGLLVATGVDLCSSCHSMDASLRRLHGGQPVERAACQQCHEPHASASKALFRESTHAPFDSGDCSTCHPGPAAPEPFATLAPLDELCGACHEETVEAAREAPFSHVAAGGGGCVSCHNPHTGDGALLAREQKSLCVDCHDPGGSSSGEETRHLSHEGFECTTCHEPHGGSRPLLLADDVVELCGSCHSHEHGVAHPLGEETRDPRTGNPMDCRSCHGIHRSEGKMYLFEEDVRMLCVSCHQEMLGR